MYNHLNKITLCFLTKYLFVLHAASDGWRVCYIGGNRFEFHNSFVNEYESNYLESNDFIKKYKLI